MMSIKKNKLAVSWGKKRCITVLCGFFSKCSLLKTVEQDETVL